METSSRGITGDDMRGDLPRDRLTSFRGFRKPLLNRERSRFAVNDKRGRLAWKRVKPFVVVSTFPRSENIAPLEHNAMKGSLSPTSFGLASGLEGCFARVLCWEVKIMARTCLLHMQVRILVNVVGS
jgi:hypothetical protein